jgi:hypothetical protein
MKFSMTGQKRWPSNIGDCLIEVTAWTGLTILRTILWIHPCFLHVFFLIENRPLNYKSIIVQLEYLSKATHTHKNKFWEHLCEFILVSCTCLFSEGHLFCPVIENCIWIEPLLRGQPSYKAISFHLSFQKSSIEFSALKPLCIMWPSKGTVK